MEVPHLEASINPPLVALRICNNGSIHSLQRNIMTLVQSEEIFIIWISMTWVIIIILFLLLLNIMRCIMMYMRNIDIMTTSILMMFIMREGLGSRDMDVGHVVVFVAE
jgi:hypothetical protein